MTGQLVFNLLNVKNFNSDDFYVNENNLEASELINMWPNWFNGVAVIDGPEKSGKSHLASILKTKTTCLQIEGKELSDEIFTKLKIKEALLEI